MTAADYAQALFEAVQETKPDDHDKVLDNFVKILADHGHLGLLEKIEEEYRRLERQAKGIREVELTAARTGIADKELLKDLNRIVGEKIEVKKKVDEGLIGGVVIRVGDTLIDASVKNSLESLKKKMSQ